MLKRGTTEPLAVTLPVAMVGSDLGLLKSLALAGAGITSLPRLSVQEALDDGRLVHVLPSWVWPQTNLFLLYRGGHFIPPKVRVFLDYMRSALDLRGRESKTS